MDQKIYQVYSDKQLENLVAQSHYGCDEAGRGALNGPVVVASVSLGRADIPELNDSKQLSEAKREALYPRIMADAEDVTVAIIEAPVIDRVNILNATLMGMRQSYSDSQQLHPLMLIDGNRIPEPPEDVRFYSVVKGDAKVPAISAASIVAKVTRDRIMVELGKQFPDMAYEIHKGYGTALHLERLDKHGVNDSYRMTFKSVRERFGTHQQSLF